MMRRRTIGIAAICRLVGRRQKAGLLCAVAVAASSDRAAGQEFEWLVQFGPGGASALTADDAGGVFTGGGQWLRRHHGDGSSLWSRDITVSAGRPTVGAIAADGAGGVLVAGHSRQPFTNEDVFLARYDSDGNRRWITEFGSSEWDGAFAVASDGVGGAFVGGYTDGDLAAPYTGFAWLARYDGDGQRVWAKQLEEDYWGLLAIAADGAGGCFVAGERLDRHAWLARYDRDGEQMWATAIASNGRDEAWSVAPDGAGGVFVAGTTTGVLGGPSSGPWDAWLARYSGDGDLVWITQWGTPEWDRAFAVTSDGVGGAFVAGHKKPPDPSRDGDIWIASHDEVGAQRWIMRLGTAGYDAAHALVTSPSGAVFAAGATGGELVPGGSGEAWLGRLAVDSCYADCDGDGELTFFDFLCFSEPLRRGRSQGGL